MVKIMDKIKSCPLCKGEASWHPRRQRRNIRGLICSIIIRCENCGAEVDEPHPKSSKINNEVVKRTIKKWNRRE